MRKVIVLGGSAGGIQALQAVLKDLPPDLSAPVLAVIHVGEGDNYLPRVLQGYTRLEVLSPTEPQPLVAGRVYVAPPNRHLAIRSDCVLPAHGPRENRHRPAIDVLFRSAARAYRSNVIAVILSGALDDGVAGSLAVQARGGTIIVQDPAQAQTPEMPANVLRAVKTEHCLPLERIGPELVRLARNGEPLPEHRLTAAQCATLVQEESLPITEPLAYTCPDCGGSLLKVDHGESEQFRCNVGHIYSLESFSQAHSHALERALWMALQRLNEQRSIQDHLAKRAEEPTMRLRYHENAAAAAEDMRLLKEILARL
jgi:two-component system, chemotaxis family, protein-glutamate methylesterase/glutaminase